MSTNRQAPLKQPDRVALSEAQRRPAHFSGHERDRLYLNVSGGKRYASVAYAAGIDLDSDGRSIAAFDFDGDGDLDLAVLSLQHLELFENRSPPGRHFIRFTLKATGSEPHALGAKVRVTSKLGTQLNRLTTVSGFATQTQAELHFGLGADNQVSAVEVSWPSGKQEQFGPLAADHRYQLVEGSGRAIEQPIVRWPGTLETLAKKQGRFPRELPGLDGQPRALRSDDRPLLVNFFASWCKACAREAPELESFARSKKAQLIGVSLDSTSSAAAAFVAAHHLSYPIFRADPKLLEQLFGGDAMQLPATLSLDAEGQVRRALFRALSAPDLAELVRAALDQGPAPKEAQAAVQRGLQLLHIGQVEQAMAQLEQVVASAPTSTVGWIGLGIAQEAKGDFVAAGKSYQRLVSLRPKDPLALHGLGRAQIATGDPAAVATMEQVVKRDPTNPVARKTLAFAYGKAGRMKEAIAAAKEAIRLDPNYVDAMLFLGLAEVSENHLPTALEVLGRATQLRPELADPHFALARALLGVGRRDEAIDELKRGLRIAPGNPIGLQMARGLGIAP